MSDSRQMRMVLAAGIAAGLATIIAELFVKPTINRKVR